MAVAGNEEPLPDFVVFNYPLYFDVQLRVVSRGASDPHNQELPLQFRRVIALGAALLISGCTTIGWELQNYAFYGETPTADGRRLSPSNVVERVVKIEGADSLLVSEGEFQIDTTRANGERVWVVSRRTTDSLKRPIIDSVWLGRSELRTLRSFHQSGDGRQTRQEFHNRVVRTEVREPSGRVHRSRLMHPATPYSRIGVELVLGALRWTRNSKGALPVVSADGREMSWLEFDVIGQASMPRPAAGGVTFQRVWVVRVKLDDQASTWWVDDEENSVVQRSYPEPDGSRRLVALGRPVRKLSLFAVAPIPTAAWSTPGTARVHGGLAEGRLLGGGRTLAPGKAQPKAARGN